MSDNLADKLAALVSPGPSGSDVRATNTPEAWKPRLEVGDGGGYLVSTARAAGEIPDIQELLKEFARAFVRRDGRAAARVAERGAAFVRDGEGERGEACLIAELLGGDLVE